jgi:hypothetical protein
LSIFIKFPSLILILLFFFIPINLKIYSGIKEIEFADIFIISKEDGFYAKAIIFTRYNVKNIDWGNINRRENKFFINIKINFGEKISNSDLEKFENDYKIGDIDIGEYSLALYINDYEYKIFNFIVNFPPIPIEEFEELIEIEKDFIKGENIWNGEEWIFKISLFLNFVPEKIDWGEVNTFNERIRNANVTMSGKWIKEKDGALFFYEHNYSLGILPEGQNSFNIILKNFNDYGLFYSFYVSEYYEKTIVKTYTVMETHTMKIGGENVTLEVPIVCYTQEVTRIKVKTIPITSTFEKTEKEKTSKFETITTTSIFETTTTAITTEALTTKTIETKIKEKFEIENFIPLSLFIIVIMITILLYYILFKRREI